MAIKVLTALLVFTAVASARARTIEQVSSSSSSAGVSTSSRTNYHPAAVPTTYTTTVLSPSTSQAAASSTKTTRTTYTSLPRDQRQYYSSSSSQSAYHGGYPSAHGRPLTGGGLFGGRPLLGGGVLPSGEPCGPFRRRACFPLVRGAAIAGGAGIAGALLGAGIASSNNRRIFHHGK